MEPSEHNWSNISETICPHNASSWQVGPEGRPLNVVLSEYPDKSHNFTNLNIYDVTLQNSLYFVHKINNMT